METTAVRMRTGCFVALLLVISVVQDGLPKFAGPLGSQILLLPFTFLFLSLVWVFLFWGRVPLLAWLGELRVQMLVVYLLELEFCCLFLYETRYFAAFGYRLLILPAIVAFALVAAGLGVGTATWRKVRPGVLFGTVLGTYAVGQALAILSFPLDYLRSDMMPVIVWADRAVLAGANPYQHFHVADRIYDFPYLPGTLLSFLPVEAMHLDPRWAAIGYIVVAMGILYWATEVRYRLAVTALVGLFVLCPYLQYRHELYTQGHFLSLVVIFVLMQRRRFAWAAVAFGVSLFISQFSWVIFPFFLMNALRRGGWREVGRMALIAGVTTAILMAPFTLHSTGSVAHNAVGQWDALERAIARPINLAFWASYVVRPAQLKWIQLVLLTGVFCFCWARGKCADLADTLRWMVAALTIFILFNVLIDGYFYLMLLVPMLVYTCAANGWLRTPAGSETLSSTAV